MTKKTKGSAHCVPGGGGFRCLRCGEEQALAYPIAMPIWAAAAKAFEGMHERCKPSERGAARMRYASADEWYASWDTGISSRTIFATFRGYGLDGGPGVPHDPDDFGRCYRLLKVAPDWRANLRRVAERHSGVGLVAHWDRLEALYEEELPTGSAPRLYALMQEIHAQRAKATSEGATT